MPVQIYIIYPPNEALSRIVGGRANDSSEY